MLVPDSPWRSEGPLTWQPGQGHTDRGHPAYKWHRIIAGDGSTIAYVPDEPTARRIVAAVNACRSIPTVALETHIVAKLIGVAEGTYTDAGRRRILAKLRGTPC